MARLLRTHGRMAVPLGRLAAVCFGALLACAPTATAEDGVSINLQDGVSWPEGLDAVTLADLRQSPRSRLIYVSSSEGNDNNSGRTPMDPLRTLQAGHDRLRDGQPDWLLLKRGDVWHEQLAGNWKKSGRSTGERMVVAPYGIGPRPRIVTPPGSAAIKAIRDEPRGYLAFIGLHIEPATHSDAEAGSVGIDWRGTANDVLFCDLYVAGHKNNFTLAAPNGARSRNFTLRACTILDAWSTGAHAQGVFAQRVDGLVVEGNVFDHNGWSDRIAGAEPSIFNHSLYIQSDCGPAVVRNNIILRTSSHGVQIRPGGVVEGNFFSSCPIGVLVGAANGGNNPIEGGVSATVTGNVFLDTRNIDNDTPRGMGVEFGNINQDGVIVSGNLFSNANASTGNVRAIRMHEFDNTRVASATITGNIVLNWGEAIHHRGAEHGPVSITDNIFVCNSTPMLRAGEEMSTTATQNLSLSSNVYIHTRPDNRFFRNGNAYGGVADYIATVDDASLLIEADGTSMLVTTDGVAQALGFASADELIQHLRTTPAVGHAETIDAAELIQAAQSLAIDVLPAEAFATPVVSANE